MRHTHTFKTAFITALACLMGTVAAQAPGNQEHSGDLTCSQTGNCINSLSGSGLLPLRYRGTATQGMASLRATLASYPDAEVVRGGPLWLEVIFTTRMGFRDQVDFVLNPQTAQIDYRSRSLVGLYDFGKNRSRMTEFAQRFAAQAPQHE